LQGDLPACSASNLLPPCVCSPQPSLTSLHRCPSAQGTSEAHSIARGILRSDRELHKLFTTLALRYRDRPGGYTRVISAGVRQYDATPMAFIEYVFVCVPATLLPAQRAQPKCQGAQSECCGNVVHAACAVMMTKRHVLYTVYGTHVPAFPLSPVAGW
jgi:hypothetical protein